MPQNKGQVHYFCWPNVTSDCDLCPPPVCAQCPSSVRLAKGSCSVISGTVWRPRDHTAQGQALIRSASHPEQAASCDIKPQLGVQLLRWEQPYCHHTVIIKCYVTFTVLAGPAAHPEARPGPPGRWQRGWEPRATHRDGPKETRGARVPRAEAGRGPLLESQPHGDTSEASWLPAGP